jgi:uncharacterized protein (TIGR04255 family)
MAKSRQLRRPPITEALVDFRAVANRPPEAFQTFAELLKTEFPKSTVRNELRTQLRVQDGKLIPPETEYLKFAGVHLLSEDETLIVQAGLSGLTLNNVKTYIGGDQIIDRALSVWMQFAEHMSISSVQRIAFRYINHFELPLKYGEDFRLYLTSPPEPPKEAPQDVSEFLSRVVAQDHDSQASAIITQRLAPTQDRPTPTVMLDIDVFRAGEFQSRPDELRQLLNSLRVLRNQIFFGLLTDATVDFFV